MILCLQNLSQVLLSLSCLAFFLSHLSLSNPFTCFVQNFNLTLSNRQTIPRKDRCTLRCFSFRDLDLFVCHHHHQHLHFCTLKIGCDTRLWKNVLPFSQNAQFLFDGIKDGKNVKKKKNRWLWINESANKLLCWHL